MQEYPWFTLVADDHLEQGDILHGFRIFLPPSEVPPDEDLDAGVAGSVEFSFIERDVVVITQSCDLVLGREKVPEVLLCAVWPITDLRGHLATAKGREDVRRGNLPGFHMLAGCTLEGFEQPPSVVEFRRVYSVPVEHVRRRAIQFGDRLRLLPPYREHLSQAFARFFMRVGLPSDIPPFK